MGFTDAWAEADAKVLAALDDTQPRTAGELGIDLPPEIIRAVLKQNVRAKFVDPHRNAVRTGYTLTEAGKRHLADTMKVA
jgi:hypothetical protein